MFVTDKAKALDALKHIDVDVYDEELSIHVVSQQPISTIIIYLNDCQIVVYDVEELAG